MQVKIRPVSVDYTLEGEILFKESEGNIMKLVLKTSNKTIMEKKERHDRHLDRDRQRSNVLDILIIALAANGVQLCGSSDAKWAYFETCIIDQLRDRRKQIE